MDIKIDHELFLTYKKDCRDASFLKEYNIDKSFGTNLKIGTHKKTGLKRAIKVFYKKNADIEQFINMTNIVSTLKHPNIIPIFEYYEDKAHFYIVTEISEEIGLIDMILDKGIFSEREAADIMKQILSVIYYLHQNNIIYK